MQPQWTSSDVTVNGNHVHYTCTGKGDKPALVLAHGFSDNGLCWTRLARALEADFDIFMPDARGHGLSERISLTTPHDMAADLAGFITALGLQKPIVAGHSMGGSTAGLAAARFPETIGKLILEDPAWFDRESRQTPPAEEENKPNPWHEWLRSLPTLTDEDITAKGKKDSPLWEESEWPAWVQSKRQLDLNILKAEGTSMEWREVARKIVCPTLLITAEVDMGAIITPAIAREAEEINPLIHSVLISGAGHNVRREKFDAVVAAIRQFLKK